MEYWLMLTSTFAICSIFLFCLYLLADSRNKDDRKTFKTLVASNLLSGCAASTLAFGTLDINHAKYIPTKSSNSLRLLTLVVCFCGMMNFCIYNAGLISCLMAHKYEIPINELSDLLIKTDYKLLVWGGSYMESYLRYSNDISYRKIWEDAVKENGILSNIADGERAIRNNDRKVYFAYYPDFPRMFKSFPCEIIAAKSSYGHHSVAYPFQNDSPYVSLFSHYMREIKEAGLNTEWVDSKYDMECRNENGEQVREFTYGDVFSAFVIPGIGCAIALLYCIVEWSYKRYKCRCNNDSKEKTDKFVKEIERLNKFDNDARKLLTEIKDTFIKKFHDTYSVDEFHTDNLFYNVNVPYEEILHILEQALLSVK